MAKIEIEVDKIEGSQQQEKLHQIIDEVVRMLKISGFIVKSFTKPKIKESKR